ncbi:glutathione reductase [Skermanella stibiiresistens SB22]|uniref:Glutathione reductase n=1 Tax=Skermanella stibiiresistens SB22 TaxID=1385369 RepID=W9HDK7_9PROT|nr:glutathione-disulfide reductase [Skermanella stibiiresistens]EWY41983.1 glutathione reductase [Skermanella stibiiresistens SB22]
MASYDFDLFTIGAGSGGVAASRRAAAYGARVAICEGSKVGGTCVIRGCVPKKLLSYGGQFRDAFEDAVGYGWASEVPDFDWSKLLAAKDREIDRLNQIYIGMLDKAGVTLIEGFGRLIDRNTVEVAGRRYTAKTILIATGGHPIGPSLPGFEHAISSNEALDLTALPSRMVIIGGGYIAVEFASIFNALGVEIMMMIRSGDLLNGFDDDIRQALATEMRKRGITIRSGVKLDRLEKHDDGYRVVTAAGEAIDTELVFAATGRVPNTRGLGLENAGVELDSKGGIAVDSWSRTNVDNIYAVGDVTNKVALTPVAIAEGRAFVETFFNDNPMEVDYSNIPTAVFSNPPIGTVGLTEGQAREICGEIDVYKSGFRPMKNTLSGRDERTVMKLVVDRKSDRVMGAHMIGPDAPEIVQGLAIAMNCGATKAQFDRTIGLHPSAAEEFVTMREKVPDPATRQAAE